MKFTMLAAHLVPVLKAMLLTASKDDTRRHLHCVQVRVVDGVLRCASTDGHRLSVYTRKLADASSNGERLLSVAFVADVVRALAKCPGEVTVSQADMTVTVSYDGGSLSAASIEQTFPPIEQIIPNSRDACDLLSFNGAYIADCQKAFSLFEKGAILLLSPTKSLGPMTVQCSKVPELRIIVMPCRVDRLDTSILPVSSAPGKVKKAA